MKFIKRALVGMGSLVALPLLIIGVLMIMGTVALCIMCPSLMIAPVILGLWVAFVCVVADAI